MKLHLLDLGRLEYDEGFPLVAGAVSTLSDPNPESTRRTVAIIGSLIEHPKIGPILFDTGCSRSPLPGSARRLRVRRYPRSALCPSAQTN